MREKGREKVRESKKPGGGRHNVTTFFISNFPEGHTEKDLWRIFHHFGKVTEVFIARKLNRWGKCSGFVRFVEVKNPRRMEHELDLIRIGDRKLYANLPRFQRSTVEGKIGETSK